MFCWKSIMDQCLSSAKHCMYIVSVWRSYYKTFDHYKLCYFETFEVFSAIRCYCFASWPLHWNNCIFFWYFHVCLLYWHNQRLRNSIIKNSMMFGCTLSDWSNKIRRLNIMVKETFRGKMINSHQTVDTCIHSNNTPFAGILLSFAMPAHTWW